MNFHHVLISANDKPDKFRCIFCDLSEKDLKRQFIGPYKKGKRILIDGEIIDLHAICRIRLIRTTDTSENELAKLQETSLREIQEFNANSNSVVFISAGRGYDKSDIVEMGQDVTKEFVTGAPGSGGRLEKALSALNNPWLVRIGAGLFVAALAWWLGWRR